MARTLDVYLHEDLVGHLEQDAHGQMTFEYSQPWLYNPKAIGISHSLPLREKRFSQKECRGFFGGILPEEGKRDLVGRNLGISAKNDYAMLEAIGGECAGAITFVPKGAPLPVQGYRYQALDQSELLQILRELPQRPLLAGKGEIRLSLAGAQDKIAVRVKGEEISLPLGGAPSSHILKPAIGQFEGLVFNEAVCMQLAKAVGLAVAEVQIRSIEGLDFLVVKRYDRMDPPSESALSDEAHAFPRRLHQEDFCQALGFVSERKYQSEGGPSLAQCFALLREVSTTPVIDLQHFLDAVIFNVLIGNHDAHAKNFSLIYERPQGESGRLKVKFAPLYDLVCTVFYPELTPKMAMKIGGEYLSENLSPKSFERLAQEADLAKPLVLRRVPEMAEKILEAFTGLTRHTPITESLKALICGRCERMISSFMP